MKVKDLYRESRQVGAYWRSIPGLYYVGGYENDPACFIGAPSLYIGKSKYRFEIRTFHGRHVTLDGNDELISGGENGQTTD